MVGHVQDTQGAAVVHANVSVMDVDTQEVRTVTSNEAGDYTVPLLKPGDYRVTAEARGVNIETQSGIVLNVDQTARVQMNLAIESTTAR